jgi:primosomal protein N'
MCAVLKPGMRVAVPFGRSNRLCGAFVTGLSAESAYESGKLKSISHLIDTQPATADYLIETAKFIRDNYFCTYAEALRTVVPSAEKIVKNIYYSAAGKPAGMTADEENVYGIVSQTEQPLPTS